ncbi:rod shape-determining protein MreD [Seongchinamella sediminis]|uniref:Rod shape-determining protein MreD n=1 Tax=Seongchinamella sediminis TaxID=2283635 RepID=A0A3L7DZ40_9GAMM|nr:rod shape-determining protein MreD [Seongchinamella sediminis]RLQ21925.1 rod shape-determining protein MreD [Seongchinamella sediminis]
MVDQQPHGYWLILASFFLALCLAILPLPHWLAWGRPEWAALVLVYWVIALPHRMGLVTALALGLMLDVVEGAVMGQNGFALTVVALLALLLYQRLRVYSQLQQSGVIFVLVGINLMICQWVQNLEGAGATTMLFLLPAVSSALLWPLVFHLLRSLRRAFLVT